MRSWLRRDPLRTRIVKVRGEDLSVQLAFVTFAYLIELCPFICNKTSEDIQPARRTLWVPNDPTCGV